MGMEIVELVMRVEEEFEIEIPDADAEAFDTVGALHRYIVQKLADDSSPEFNKERASDEIWNKLRSIIADEFALPLERVTPEAHLVYDLDLG
jgi:acyl carrier protein